MLFSLKQIIYKLSHPFVRGYWRLFKPKTCGSRALIINDDNILLVKNINVNHWSLPGGKIDRKETPEECLIRELKEELNLNISNIDYKLGEYISTNEGKKDIVNIFIVQLEDSYFEKQWELDDAKWFSLSLLPENISPAGLRRIEEFKSGSRNLQGNW